MFVDQFTDRLHSRCDSSSLEIFFSFFKNMASNGGNFGLQDFQNDAIIQFGSNFPNKDPVLVSKIHQDLLDAEISLTKKAASSKTTTSQINFVIVKLGIYGARADEYLQLYELTGLQGSDLLYFHSASGDDLPSIADMTESYKINVAGRSVFNGENETIFPGINEEIFDNKVRQPVEIQGKIETAKIEYCASAEIYARNVRNDKMAKSLEEDLIQKMATISKKRENYDSQLKPFVHDFWHSEPRLLSHLQAIHPCVSDAVKLKVGVVKLIILHVHSRFNVCDNCRLQLTGAIYKWMYRHMLSLFPIECNGPIPIKFHLIVSHNGDPGKRIDYKNSLGGNQINIDEVASVGEIDESFGRETKPFVSIVQLPALTLR